MIYKGFTELTENEKIAADILYREFGSKDPLHLQVQGAHYKNLKIQPVEYAHANQLDWFQGESIKYITRHKDKNKSDDIKKAIHILQIYLKLEYGETYELK
jgi:hypothetical protein